MDAHPSDLWKAVQATYGRPYIERKNTQIGNTEHFFAENPTYRTLFWWAEIRVFAHEEKVGRKYAKYGALFERISARKTLVSSPLLGHKNTENGGRGELAFSYGTSNPHGQKAQKPPS